MAVTKDALVDDSRWLGGVEEVPTFQRRKYILHYYRLGSPRFRHLYLLHNESVNIWTHIAAASLTLLHFWWWLAEQEPPWALERVRSFYFIGVVLWFIMSISVFGVSATYHWKRCAREEDFDRWYCLDVSFCGALVVMGFLSGVPMGFHCHGELRTMYMALSFLVVVITAFVMRNVRDAEARFLTLTSASLFFIIPAVHFLWVSRAGREAMIFQIIMCMVTGTAGAVICSQMVPECFSPGRFDILGHSHQIWHILIFATVTLYTKCLVNVFQLTSSAGFCE